MDRTTPTELYCPKCELLLEDAGFFTVQCHSCKMLWPEQFLIDLLRMDDETE